MATLTIKDIPDEVHAALKLRAQMNRRSLNSEVVLYLERAVKAEPFDVEGFLARAAERRASFNKDLYVTDAELNRAKRDGRL